MVCGLMLDRPPRAARGSARDKLLNAAIDLFGSRGFDGVSTREIAARAGVNIAGIAYQFGGKEELYRACIAHIAGFVQSRMVQQALAQPASDVDPRKALETLCLRFARFMVATQEMERFARMVVREQMDPTPAFDILYDSVFAPMHAGACALWAKVTGGDPESQAVKLAVFGVLGNILMFRMARAGVMRRLDWTSIGETEVAVIETQLRHTLAAALSSFRLGDAS
ncbi:MAG: CerR family C-terminal domain-containing protein [Rhizobiales bacterium]|nr:CerR family C-terminal domain-containing protein [Hyphomicrobiales bacterium]